MKQIISLTLIISLLAVTSYLMFEPEIIKAAEDSLTVTLTVTSEISISDAANITMDSAITLTQATSTGGGNSPWNVKCNDKDGWTLTVKASQTPALQSGGDQIDGFNAATTTWSGEVVDEAQFGFSIFGDDVSTEGWGTDDDCTSTSSGVPSAALYWRGFDGTNEITVVVSNTTTTSAGSNTYLCVAAEQNDYYIADGTYTATITGTATQQ